MPELAIIGGTGLTDFVGLDVVDEISIATPYGDPSALIIEGRVAGQSCYFFARHGNPHVIPPHLVNYRANIWALKELGVKRIVGVNAVGGIGDDYGSGVVVVPHQLIDYTHGREFTFYKYGDDEIPHYDFTSPFTPSIREGLIQAGRAAVSDATFEFVEKGVYAVTQGPRLETSAEIDRFERDGCQLVGMTVMPEAGLARELGMDYATLALVVNPAAGRGEAEITMDDIRAVMQSGMEHVRRVLIRFVGL